MPETTHRLQKRATRIRGLDSATEGGLPAAGTTLVYGSAGSGKTVLGLQILAAAAGEGEHGLFISFEESAEQLATDASSFIWGPGLLASEYCRLIDARPGYLAQGAGNYDLSGLVSLLEHEAAQAPLAWVVLDATDQLLKYHPDEHGALAEIARLNDWARRQGVSLLFTAKEEPGAVPGDGPTVARIQFLLDTVLRLTTETVLRRQNRRFSVRKYRGSGHSTDELPVVLDSDGMHLPYDKDAIQDFPSTGAHRISTGVAQLDEVLRGGLWAGSTTLVSGKPGTAKTSLAVAFAAAAAGRGETVLYVTFDEVPDRVVRNAGSIGIALQPLIDQGLLHISAREAWRFLVEEHYIAIQQLMDEFGARYLVIDPISALAKAASAEGPYIAAERILSLARARGATTLMTSLADLDTPAEESTLSHTSTLVETWISLGYEAHAGERNRTLSIIKSRGTAHSNQVRELVLSDDGIALAEVYQFGSEVLMGTARLEKEARDRAARESIELRQRQRQRQLERELREQHAELERLQAELDEVHSEEIQTAQEAEAYREAVIQRRQPGPAESTTEHDHEY